MGYLIKEGQIDLYGSQLAALQWYQVAWEAESSSDHKPPPEHASMADQ